MNPLSKSLRFRLAIASVFFLAGGAGLAQLFNLETEGEEPKIKQGPKSNIPIRVPAYELPDADTDSKEQLDKIYEEILSAIKANNVDRAQEIISDYDVITKQKIIYRLMQEPPSDSLREVASPPRADVPAEQSPSQEAPVESPSIAPDQLSPEQNSQ